MIKFGRDPESGKIKVPVYELLTAQGVIDLDWDNSIIRSFEEVQYDHVEYEDETGQKYGLKLDEDTMEELRGYRWPELFMPIADDSTINWLGNILMSDLVDVERLEDIG